MGGNPKIRPEDVNVIMKFGGGLHTRASPDEIDGREAADGFNFTLDIQNRNLRNRPPFDLIGTTPNAQSINGGFSLLTTAGTVTTCFQAGTTVYKWDGHTTFTSKGSANSGSKLRGHWKSHVWNLTDVVLVTDLSLIDTVKKWDGTTYSNVTFTNEVAAAFGSFSAKYLNIENERAIFGNVKSGSATPHLIVGCKRGDYTVITVNQRPSSSLGAADPYFLLSPDLKPINGLIASFKGSLTSSEKGQIYALTGTDATDFAFIPFFALSGASGAESVEETGNDFVYGRAGRIESVTDTNTYGNSESSDMTAIVSDKIAAYTGWTIKFNSRTRKLYAFPAGVSEVWVQDQAIREGGQLSPWMKWTTTHAMAFQPTFVESMLDPVDGLEYIFMGDSSGNVYRMEGTGASGDGGTAQIETQFMSKLFSARLDAKTYDMEGYIKYARLTGSASVTLTFKYQGESIFDKSITATLSAATSGIYFGGSNYYSGSFYYGFQGGRLSRTRFTPPGQESDFQVLVDVTGTADFSINEIGIRFRESTP